jgi:hypothetical protein
MLYQNYPNPFNPVTHFEFRIADLGLVKVSVYDAIGKEAAILLNEELNAGTYKVNFDGSNFPSGVYFYRIETKNFKDSKKMVLVK